MKQAVLNKPADEKRVYLGGCFITPITNEEGYSRQVVAVFEENEVLNNEDNHDED